MSFFSAFQKNYCSFEFFDRSTYCVDFPQSQNGKDHEFNQAQIKCGLKLSCCVRNC